MLLLFSCTQTTYNKGDSEVKKKMYYSSKGFALIYEDFFYKNKVVGKKLDNSEYQILHMRLKSRTLVKIYNPENSKFVTAKVKSISKFPSIYNSVITKKIADDLNLDKQNPYIEIIQIKKNPKFTAKEAMIYDEEKNVADKAPVSTVDINDLSSTISKIKVKKNKPSYIIQIADFYYYDSAKAVKDKFENEANLMGIDIKKISNNSFRVYSGPYDSFDSMKNIFFILSELGFENFNVINTNK